jgi:hypothetical protein
VYSAIKQENPDVIYFDMVHNYAFDHDPNPISYQTLITQPIMGRIDIGSFVFKTELGKSVGFNRRDQLADGAFFEDMKATGPSIVKIPKVLFVHN